MDITWYGHSCFRISKYIRDNQFFVGHFVVVLEDQRSVLPEVAKYIELASHRLENLRKAPTEPASLFEGYWSSPIEGIEKDVDL